MTNIFKHIKKHYPNITIKQHEKYTAQQGIYNEGVLIGYFYETVDDTFMTTKEIGSGNYDNVDSFEEILNYLKTGLQKIPPMSKNEKTFKQFLKSKRLFKKFDNVLRHEDRYNEFKKDIYNLPCESVVGQDSVKLIENNSDNMENIVHEILVYYYS